MQKYTPYQLTSLIGKSIIHRHIASDTVYGPVRVIAVHAGSDTLVVSGDPHTGRCYSLLIPVTLIQLSL
jgi:hypothetical protein